MQLTHLSQDGIICAGQLTAFDRGDAKGDSVPDAGGLIQRCAAVHGNHNTVRD